MAPPPETPTPRRFVIPKKHSGTGLPPRQSQQQQQKQPHNATPKSSLPLPPIVHTTHSSSQVGHPQFHVTPRFSLHSTPRPPRASQQAPQYQHSQPGPPSTPAAPPGSAYLRSSRIKNVAQSVVGDEDVIDSSPPDGDFEDEDDEGPREPQHGEGQDGLPVLPKIVGTHLRRRPPENEVDWIVTESSPPAGDDDADGSSAAKHDREEADPSSTMSYSDIRDDTAMARSPKRRRVSISSLPPFDSERDEGLMRLSSLPPDFVEFVEPSQEEESSSTEDHGNPEGITRKREDEEMQLPLAGADGDPVSLAAKTETAIGEGHERTLEEGSQSQFNQQQRQQPAFHRAPRFKQQQNLRHPDAERHYDPLPEAFSPSRRQNKNANKYVPNGLASELRDWLVDMEAATGPKREHEWLAKIVVDEMPDSAGSPMKSTGMQLVYGRHLISDPRECDQDLNPEKDDVQMTNDHESIHTETQMERAPDPGSRAMIILAGDGRVTPGIAKRKPVRCGVVVGIARPTWEITLGALGRWAVACDWAILE